LWVVGIKGDATARSIFAPNAGQRDRETRSE